LSAIATFDVYDDILNQLAQETTRGYQLVQRRTYEEMNAMIEADELDLAFVCAGAYAALSPDAPMDVLLVPETDGVVGYSSLFVTRTDSPAQSVGDLAGARLAVTDPLSLTGYTLPMARVLELGGDPQHFFGALTWSGSHDRSLEALDRGLVDAASVMSIAFDRLLLGDGPYAGRLRILERSRRYPPPPLLVSRHMTPELRAHVVTFFTTLDRRAAGREHLSRLGIDRFVPPPQNLDYESVRTLMERVQARSH